MNHRKNKARGITLIGFAVLLCVVGLLRLRRHETVSGLQRILRRREVDGVAARPNPASRTRIDRADPPRAQRPVRYCNTSTKQRSAAGGPAQHAERRATVCASPTKSDIPFMYNVDFLVALRPVRQSVRAAPPIEPCPPRSLMHSTTPSLRERALTPSQRRPAQQRTAGIPRRWRWSICSSPN